MLGLNAQLLAETEFRNDQGNACHSMSSSIPALGRLKKNEIAATKSAICSPKMVSLMERNSKNNMNLVCPSTKCWKYNESSKSCDLKPECSEISCSAIDMTVNFHKELFGLENFDSYRFILIVTFKNSSLTYLRYTLESYFKHPQN